MEAADAETLVPPPALGAEVLGEYVYTNFPWSEILPWLAPQIAWARRIVLLDGTDLAAARLMLSDPGFPRARVAGIWERVHPAGSLLGVPFLKDEQALVAARPDLILSTLMPSNPTFPALTHLHVLTRAAIFPNLMLAHPFSGSLLLWPAGPGEPSNILAASFPPVLRASVVRHVARYLFASGWARGKDVLDVACGNGYGAHLLSRVARSVTGVDLNTHLVGFARRRNAASNVEYLCADLTKLPPEPRSDVAVSVETFEHIASEGLGRFVGALHGLLRPGGTLLCTTPFARETIRNPLNREHVAEYSADDFTGALSERFDVLGLCFQQEDGTFLDAVPDGHPAPQSVDPAHLVQIAVARPR